MSNVAAGKDTDDEGESLNDVEKTLTKLDVKLRDSIGEWRSFEEVLDEVAEKWQSGAFNEVEKSQVATAIAGKQNCCQMPEHIVRYDAMQYKLVA